MIIQLGTKLSPAMEPDCSLASSQASNSSYLHSEETTLRFSGTLRNVMWCGLVERYYCFGRLIVSPSTFNTMKISILINKSPVLTAPQSLQFISILL
jgi:hypothetical protein